MNPSVAASPLVAFTARLVSYLSLWILAALALQIFLRPESLSETNLSPLQQRALWPAYTLHMVVVGLAQAATWPNHFPAWAPWIAVTALAIQALCALISRPPRLFLTLISIQVILLTLGVLYFVRQSYLPNGG